MAREDLSSGLTSPDNAQRPTRTRYWVIVFAVTLAIILYIDRTLLGQAAPTDPRGPPSGQDPDGHRVLRVSAGLRTVRNPRRPTGGLAGPPQGPPSGHRVVVALHRRHGPGRGARLAGGDPIHVRRGRSGMLPQFDQGLHPVADEGGTHAGPRHHVDERPLGRRRDAFPDVVGAPAHVVAVGISDVRPAGCGVGGGLLLLVPRPPPRPSECERGGAGVAQGQ